MTYTGHSVLSTMLPTSSTDEFLVLMFYVINSTDTGSKRVKMTYTGHSVQSAMFVIYHVAN